MYRKESEGWLKHYDFVLLDMICLQLAFILAYAISGQGWNPYSKLIYRNIAIFIELADAVALFSLDTLKSVLKRGYYQEFRKTIYNGVCVGVTAIVYLFLLHQSQNYSRMALILLIILYIGISYCVRLVWKDYLIGKMKNGGGDRSLMIVTTKDIAASVVQNMKNHNYARFTISGIAVIDCDMVGSEINGIQVVANEENAAMYVCRQWIDEVLLVLSQDTPYPEKLMKEFAETGVTVHLNLAKTENVLGKKQFVEKIGDYTVLTTTMNYASAKQLLAKRLMDIAGGLAGCLLTAIIFVFVAPMIYISSPGPIFFAQERVGKNGKKFKMYKFRSMYMDAEERKAELMKQNKMSDSKMFKMDFDPRVIGNKILPDGTKKTGIGDFIRRTSLDEFPQFFNVLKGDMSIVGTRPPLIGEVSEYELHHRARLAIKPGITGMWQVSGRSDITDFEEVVRLDTQYINEWNVGMDIKILIKTVLVVLRKDGSV